MQYVQYVLIKRCQTHVNTPAFALLSWAASPWQCFLRTGGWSWRPTLLVLVVGSLYKRITATRSQTKQGGAGEKWGKKKDLWFEKSLVQSSPSGKLNRGDEFVNPSLVRLPQNWSSALGNLSPFSRGFSCNPDSTRREEQETKPSHWGMTALYLAKTQAGTTAPLLASFCNCDVVPCVED